MVFLGICAVEGGDGLHGVGREDSGGPQGGEGDSGGGGLLVEEAMATLHPHPSQPGSNTGHRVGGAHNPTLVPQRHEQGPGHRIGQQTWHCRWVSIFFYRTI